MLKVTNVKRIKVSSEEKMRWKEKEEETEEHKEERKEKLDEIIETLLALEPFDEAVSEWNKRKLLKI